MTENSLQPPAIFLMGPTASGKTDAALALARRLPCEIISVDSAQVYRGMDIGTAKPDRATLARFPHHLVDIRDPAEPYSAAEFRRDALACIDDIVRRGRIPLLVGGTMLYFRALQQGLADMPASDPAVRAQVMADAAREGWPAMHARLAEVDPAAAARLHPNHSHRIARALEVYLISGKPLSRLHQDQHRDHLPYRLLTLALLPDDREAQSQRIAHRFQQMLDNGFLSEVERLYRRKDLHMELPSIRSVGYREAWLHLGGKLTREEMIARAIISTRQLAKRQLTWLRGWPDLQAIPVDRLTAAGSADAEAIASAVCNKVVDFLGLPESRDH